MKADAAPAEETKPTQNERVITIRIQESINLLIEDAVRTTGLKKADVIRLAIERGVTILEQQLLTQPKLAPSSEAITDPAASENANQEGVRP